MCDPSLLNCLVNGIFAGLFTDELLSDEVLLKEFRTSDVKTLQCRVSLAKRFSENSDAFKKGICKIRSKFNEDDIIKMLTVEPKLYDHEEFKKISKYNPESSIKIYKQYISSTKKFKLILLGNSLVGKSCFIEKCTRGTFVTEYIPTVGSKQYSYEFKNEVLFDVYDCAGKDEYSIHGAGYYIHGQCAIIMCSLESPDSVRSISSWLRELKQVCGDIPIILCGNKSDSSNIKVSERTIKRISKKYSIPYVITSVKENINLELAFSMLSDCLLST